jgi:hypothetical protein
VAIIAMATYILVSILLGLIIALSAGGIKVMAELRKAQYDRDRYRALLSESKHLCDYWRTCARNLKQHPQSQSPFDDSDWWKRSTGRN